MSLEQPSILKLLKDYPVQTWLKAADGCEYCKAPYEFRVTWIDETGCFGDVETRIQHREGCMSIAEYDENFCEDSHDVAGWEFHERPITIQGHQLIPLKSKANIGPCLHCWKLIVGVPLILFIDQGKGGEIDLCFPCAEKLGVLDQLKGGIR